MKNLIKGNFLKLMRIKFGDFNQRNLKVKNY